VARALVCRTFGGREPLPGRSPRGRAPPGRDQPSGLWRQSQPSGRGRHGAVPLHPPWRVEPRGGSRCGSGPGEAAVRVARAGTRSGAADPRGHPGFHPGAGRTSPLRCGVVAPGWGVRIRRRSPLARRPPPSRRDAGPAARLARLLAAPLGPVGRRGAPRSRTPQDRLARPGLRHQPAGRSGQRPHRPGLHRRLRDPAGGYRLAPQPRPALAGELRGALAAAALAAGGRLVPCPSARCRWRQQQPQLAVGGQQLQQQALHLQPRQSGALRRAFVLRWLSCRRSGRGRRCRGVSL